MERPPPPPMERPPPPIDRPLPLLPKEPELVLGLVDEEPKPDEDCRVDGDVEGLVEEEPKPDEDCLLDDMLFDTPADCRLDKPLLDCRFDTPADCLFEMDASRCLAPAPFP